MRFQDMKFKIEAQTNKDSTGLDYSIVHEETGLRLLINMEIQLHTKFSKHVEIYAQVLANQVLKHYKKADKITLDKQDSI